MKNLTVLYTIVLLLFSLNAFSQVETVNNEQRSLLAVINLTTAEVPGKIITKLHLDEEVAAREVILNRVGSDYKKIIFLFRKETTEENVVSALAQLANDETTRAVDVIIYTHGHGFDSKEGAPSLGLYREDHVFVKSSELAVKFKSVAKNKLRMLYSDACWSSQQNQDWLNAGFVVVAGSKKVDANMTIDLKRFLKLWSRGESFGDAIEFANQNIFSKLMDFVIRGNSKKLTAGQLNITINSGFQNFNFDSIQGADFFEPEIED